MTPVSTSRIGAKANPLTHDTFLLFRMDDCHIGVKEDTFISRHHLLLEACPPQASKVVRSFSSNSRRIITS